MSSRVIHDSSSLNLVIVRFFVHNGDGIVIYGVVVRSVVYSYWVIFLCSDKALMSSASVIHSFECFPNILDVA